jgi:hypothetical protein
VIQPAVISREWPRQLVAGSKSADLLGKHLAGNGWLGGGRNSLLESAQEATLSSVAFLAFQRQSNSLTPQARSPCCMREFSFARRIEWTYGSPRLQPELFDAGKLKHSNPFRCRETPLY